MFPTLPQVKHRNPNEYNIICTAFIGLSVRYGFLKLKQIVQYFCSRSHFSETEKPINHFESVLARNK